MKTFNGYLYIEGNEVVCNPELMPVAPGNHLEHPNGWEEIMGEYQQALIEWKLINIEVENAQEYTYNDDRHSDWYVELETGDFRIKKDGQSCTCKMSGEKAVVISLNT